MVRVVLSLATNISWDLWKMDVENVFLQGDLEEKVSMLQPPGLKVEKRKIFKLNKVLYSLN